MPPIAQLLIIYDGECPLCSRYADMSALRARGIEVTLKNAREPDVTDLFPEAAQHDLDQGMLVRWQGEWFHGAQAVTMISRLVRQAPLAGYLRSAAIAKWVYPVLWLGRRVLLAVKGVPPIGGP